MAGSDESVWKRAVEGERNSTLLMLEFYRPRAMALVVLGVFIVNSRSI